MLKKNNKKICLNVDILIIFICILFFIINHIFYKYVKNDFYRFIPINLINKYENDKIEIKKDLIKDHIKKEMKNKNIIKKEKEKVNNNQFNNFNDYELINNNYSPFVSLEEELKGDIKEEIKEELKEEIKKELKQTEEEAEEEDLDKVIDEKVKIVEKVVEKPIINSPNDYYRRDLLKEYDRAVLYDGLEAPLRRVPRHVLHPPYFHNMVNIPTQGYPDNYRLLGLLIKVSNNSNENKILQLFGRETYPSSSRYEYYTSISADVDRIKIPIYSKNNKELYDDDIISINELGDDYKVQLHKIDHYRYNPYLI